MTVLDNPKKICLKIKIGNKGKHWQKGEVMLPPGQAQVIFRATRGSSFQGDIAVDDLTLWSSHCPSGPIPTTSSTKTVTPQLLTSCPPGYEYLEGKCYYMSLDRKTHSEAEKACGKYGGTLAQIKNETIYRFVTFLRTNPEAAAYYIGT